MPRLIANSGWISPRGTAEQQSAVPGLTWPPRPAAMMLHCAVGDMTMEPSPTLLKLTVTLAPEAVADAKTGPVATTPGSPSPVAA